MDEFPKPELLPRLFRLTALDTREETDRDWMVFGSCTTTDPEMFFPDKGGSPRDAKVVCEGCDVRERCLEWALEHNEQFGIWGGLSERQRHQLRVQREGKRGRGQTWQHGTVTGYGKGCHTDAACPGNLLTGETCAQARREYARVWNLRHRSAS